MNTKARVNFLGVEAATSLGNLEADGILGLGPTRSANPMGDSVIEEVAAKTSGFSAMFSLSLGGLTEDSYMYVGSSETGRDPSNKWLKLYENYDHWSVPFSKYVTVDFEDTKLSFTPTVDHITLDSGASIIYIPERK